MISNLYSKKEWAVALILSLFLTLFFIDFQPLVYMTIANENQVLQLPALFLFPLLLIFMLVQLSYVKWVYADGNSIAQKSLFFSLNVYLIYLLFNGGFWLWKNCNGNIDTLLFGKVSEAFQLNVKNVLFWVLYQTLFLVYGFSLLKILVSPSKKQTKNYR
ncbi:MAG: hypothetical protein ACPHXR_05045 [Flavicella sp.]